jgi:thiol-disulfide isomerase/thioredoxin
MKRLVIIPILLIASAMQSWAQKDTARGINFLEHVSWQQVLQKAKAENKYIFVDCYASWCGPCKWMDKHVYSNDTVGMAMNDQFLSVKLQMDSTRHDNAEVTSWYATAHLIGVQYHINGYPSLLFFSPGGRIVHEDIGTKDMQDFIVLAKTARDPQQQYYTLLANFEKSDKKNYSIMPYLANIARKLGHSQEESEIVQTYVQGYLEQLPIEKLWTSENLPLIGSFSKVIHSGDRLFQMYYRDRKRIDSIMKEVGYSDRLINSVIYKEEITPSFDMAIKGKSEPHWHRIERTIKRKYTKDYAERNVIKGQVEFYRTIKEWNKYITYFIRWQGETSLQTIKNGSGHSAVAASFLNQCAWEIFQYSKQKKELDTALSWVNLALSIDIKPNPQAMDTKANLLYKLGRKDEAVMLEGQSYSLASKDKDIEENLKKMKSGLPTWPVNDEKKGQKE